jgi:hypothetical protein
VIPRLAVLTDFPEEGWPTMDLCGDMLLKHLPRDGPLAAEAARHCPLFCQIATRLLVISRLHTAFDPDRSLNRFDHYFRYAILPTSVRQMRMVPIAQVATKHLGNDPSRASTETSGWGMSIR